MTRKTGPAGRALIKRFEGLRLNAYRCPAGRWTIGWGHTASATAIAADAITNSAGATGTRGMRHAGW